MPSAPGRFSDLIAESRTLDPARDFARLADIYEEAATLVDCAAEPRKWAALRSMAGRVLMSGHDRPWTIKAYRDALTIWDPKQDHDSWATCHFSLGSLLALEYPPGTPEADQAIASLELSFPDFPDAAHSLAALYRYRTVGDPHDNWQKWEFYAQFSLNQVSPADDPAGWASHMNEVAFCWTAEPGAPFEITSKKRLAAHLAALDVFPGGQPPPPGTPALKVWVETCINLNDSYAFQVGGNPVDDQKKSEFYARQAVDACAAPGAVPADLHVQALLALARALGVETADPLPRIEETLKLYDQAAALIDPSQFAVMASNIDKFRASSYLRLIELGHKDVIDQLVAAAESAYARLDLQTYSPGRRAIMQMEAEALVLTGRYPQAIGCLERAVKEGETALAEATTRPGRLERVFDLRDSWALLAYCHLEAEDIPAALECLDRGKSRFWREDAVAASYASFASLIPSGGALVFPLFAAAKGAIVAVAASGAAICWLPDFGKIEVRNMLSGDPATGDLGGWLKARAFCHSDAASWVQKIDSIGADLYNELWKPLIVTLTSLGVGRDAELVWFPQAGIGALPIHAAWTTLENGRRHWILEDYAIRYAPSVRALLRTAELQTPDEAPLIVSDPQGDLKFALFESAWIRAALPATAHARIFEGTAATSIEILNALPNASLAHFTTHARFDVSDPFASVLVLANDQQLTLDTMLPLLRQSPPAMVVLSACESAQARVTGIIDEMLGFPTAFLENGTRTVVATLWEVEDSSASILIGQFYRELLKEGKSPAQALRRAQNWLRTLTIGGLEALLKNLKNTDPGPAGALAAKVKAPLRAVDPAFTPYAHPFYWAAFTASGK